MSCPTASACTAVGENVSDGPLALGWDGTRWHGRAISGQDTKPPLTGVSCSAVTACTAVGFAATSNGTLTLAEHWNGHNWAVQTTQNPAPA